MKVAIVHYWLVKMRGGEKVLEALCEMYPQADIYTHVCKPDAISAEIRKHKIFTSFIAKLPFSTRLYQSYLPLMPFALKRIDLSDYDLVISSESGPAKGVTVGSETRHICYCHTPMRYLWDMYDVYLKNAGMLTGFFMRVLVPWLRRWDRATSDGVDKFIANSHFVQQRIKDVYGRDSQVIYPPVAIEEFVSSSEIGDYYLYAGELTEYKQPQLAIEAFNQSGRKLLVIGDGSMNEKLKSASRNNVQFLGRQDFETLKYHFSHCKALIFPGIEDFGILPVEVMASGRPVIAFRAGGALETVVDGVTGLFFDEQTPEALNSVIEKFESHAEDFESESIMAEMGKFSKSCFITAFRKQVALLSG